MRQTYYLLRHELHCLFMAPATYLAGILFLLLMGLIYFSILREFANAPQDVLPARLFFELFWIPVLFMVPLLTMRSFAEERRLGTLEVLFSAPVSASSIVLAKFLSAWIFYAFLWGLTLAFPWLTVLTTDQEALTPVLLEPGTLIGGYTFILLSGMLFTAVGIFASCLTRSQLVAGMLSFSILFMLILGPRLLELQGAPYLPIINIPFEYLRLFTHLEDFSRGILDTRPFAYYLTNTVLVLGLGILVVERKN
jgi:ABC-2 type transport system permease protein